MKPRNNIIEETEGRVNELFGLKPEESLESVNFATTENQYLNEYQHDREQE
ncbi:hypothetical protein JOC77_000617 [Peribacillus deserti]|uniref:Bacitracin ABC transporter ATP-binding protein n=1 Tax=Peribacillus deserti TaxID=673318 RepID=A0ABS2QDN6_9BACI|nr:hypothetical protein [Peribacillus deserti]MBM7691212.1 hypothetical protein [Peribacillus deserti]